jgi:cell shape-determining protein MreC
MDSEAWKQPKLKPESYLALSEQFQAWKSELSQLVACEPVTPMVTEVKSDTIVINAGSESGIRKGDEWLLADPRKFPSQLMDKNGASQTLLAQVENVSPYQAELTILAGPAQSVQKNWRAWPTETLVKEPANPPSGNGFFKR